VASSDLYAVTPTGSIPKAVFLALLSFYIWPFYGTLVGMIWATRRFVIQ
jgi:hypothetical protein